MVTEHHSFSSVRLSIVVPSYGEPKYLHETLTSIIESQDDSVEIIVLDDCSPTNYIRIMCEDFHSRIRYIRNEINLGVSGNFNKALDVSANNFVQIIGHDDILTESMLKVLQENLDKLESSFAILPKVSIVNGNGANVFSLSDFTKSIISPAVNKMQHGSRLRIRLMLGNWTYFPSIIWNKNNLPQNPFINTLNYCMDWDLLLRMSYTKFGILNSNLTGFTYRRHKESISMAALPILRLREERKVLQVNCESNMLSLILVKLAPIPFLNYFLSQAIYLTKRIYILDRKHDKNI